MGSFAFWLSLAIGFLSLSQEILWVRLVSFAHHGVPQAFSFVLACYLVGIAFGAAIGKKICASGTDLYRAAALVLLAIGLSDLALPWLVPDVIGATYSVIEPLLLISASAGLKSIMFPIAHQLGSVASGPRVGRSVSRIYFANILGSTLGPLVTGFVLLDHLPVERCFELSGWIALALAAACLAPARRPAAMAAALSLAGVAWASDSVPHQGLLQGVAGIEPDASQVFLANKHGVVHTVRRMGHDVVLGGNVYDGVASVDVDGNLNGLDRVYILAAAHPAPKRVLVIGLSGGAWTRTLLGLPQLERVDVVEINPAYLAVVQRYPEIRPVLTDPRVRIHIDDGRRWIKRHPQERYDLVVQNTTFHWRAGSTNVLSLEYMREVRAHLAPGGIASFNTTGSADVLATAQAAFPWAGRYGNFAYAAEAAPQVRPERLAAVRRPDGRFFDPQDRAAPHGVAARLAGAGFQPVPALLAAQPQTQAQVITDDNMLTEYRHGRRFGPMAWLPFLPDTPPGFR